MYIVCLKDKIAVATAICKDIDRARADFPYYDDIQEITAEDFDNMPIPSILINGKWEKTDETPVVEYPQKETQAKPTDESSIYDELAAAYKEGVNEA